MGMLEAMHNLGVIYMQGEVEGGKADSFRALAWFDRAASFGFTHSAYNAAKLCM